MAETSESKRHKYIRLMKNWPKLITISKPKRAKNKLTVLGDDSESDTEIVQKRSLSSHSIHTYPHDYTQCITLHIIFSTRINTYNKYSNN